MTGEGSSWQPASKEEGFTAVTTASTINPQYEATASSTSIPPRRTLGRRIVDVLTYAPARLRHEDPSKPPEYSVWLNVLFGVAGTFTVANLYYSHPILNILARDFGVSDAEVSNVPALAQSGYAAGLLFINPIADSIKRRPFVLGLMLCTALMWIGLCVTRSFAAFEALTFLTSVTTVTPQLMIPLVADLAPPERRATAVSIVTSGLLLGLLFARVMSGIVAQFVSWRYTYWIALGLQLLSVMTLFFTMPDFPRKNRGINYFRMLGSIATILWRNPLLVQASMMAFFTGAVFTSFWTTLTFLLAGAPYYYDPVVIGCFAFIGIAATCFGPPVSRYFIDKTQPLVSALAAQFIALASVVIGTFTGNFTVAGPIIQAIGIDLGFQLSQIANRSAIYGIDPAARNRINTAYMVALFLGQLMGTSVGNHLYAEGGWRLSGISSIAFMAASMVCVLLRGPFETRWLGWRGGWAFRRSDLPPSSSSSATHQQQRQQQQQQHEQDPEKQMQHREQGEPSEQEQHRQETRRQLGSGPSDTTVNAGDSTPFHDGHEKTLAKEIEGQADKEVIASIGEKDIESGQGHNRELVNKKSTLSS